MFDDIGGKIKRFAKAYCWVEIISCIVVGIILLVEGSTLAGVLCIVVGSLVSWVSAWGLYAFGEITDKVSKIQNDIAILKEEMSNSKKVSNGQRYPSTTRSIVQSVSSNVTSIDNSMVDSNSTVENNTDNNNKKKGKDIDIDPEWIIEGSTWVKCPQCGQKRPRDFIKATKKCPVCGTSAYKE